MPANLLIAILGGGIYLAAGLAWSKEAWSHGRFGFDLGWLVVAIIVSRAFTARLDNRVESRKEWFRFLWPCLPVFLLEGAADFVLRLYRGQPSEILLFGFVSLSCAFLLAALSWIMTFPYEYAYGGSPSHAVLKHGRRAFLAAGFIIGAILIIGSYWSANHGHLLSDQIDLAELWFYKGSFIVYSFLAIRILFPFVAREA